MAADDGPERHASEARRRLEAIRRALNADIAARLTRLNQRGGVLASEKDDLDAARRVRAQVIALLREDGLPVVIAAAEAQVMDAVDDVLRDVPRSMGRSPIAGPLDVTFDAEAKASIARSVSGVLDEVTAVFREGAKAMQRAVDLGVSSNASLAEVTQNVADAIDVTFAKATVAVDLAVRGAGQLAIVQQAERGGEAAGEEMLWLYDGARPDAKIREFCAEMVGRVFTLDALKGMDNGTGFPVVPHRGGPNCRHRLSPITREDAVAEGYEIVEA
jgi:hypothetical protein